MKLGYTASCYLRRTMIVPAFLLLSPVFAQPSAPSASSTPATTAPTPQSGSAAAPPKPLTAEEQAAIDKTASTSGGSTVVLSPFEVGAEEDRGYAAANTLSGTRLNSRLEDIAGSLSVVTKQQLLDTAALDINDIFLYEVGTEGTGQFTDLSNDGRGDYDNVSGNPTGSNRMRGLSAASITVGGFSASSSIPIDTYNVDAIEISRGPNSSMAGLSEGGGNVNLVQSKANLSREISSVLGRVDSYGGFRAQLDLNRPIIRNKLAVRFSAVYSELGYIRKPSVERTDRQTISLTYKPFPTTTISASVERYSQFAQRANAVNPSDTGALWRSRGSPTYDPVTFTYQVNGIRSGPITNINQLPLGIVGLGSSNVRIQQYIDGGAIQFMQRGVAPVNTIVGTSSLTQVVQSSNVATGGPLYKIPNVTDKSVYNWEKINLAASGYATGYAITPTVSIDQSVWNTPRNRTDARLAWRREDEERYQRQFIGQLDGVGSSITIDATERFLDGTPNPFVGRPYIGGNQPQVFKRPSFTDTYLAQVAHRLDLRQEPNLLKWLGAHNVVVYGENVTNFSTGNGYRYTDIVVDNPVINPLALPGGSRIRNESRFFPRYYMGDAQGGNIDYANGGPVVSSGAFKLRYLDPTASSWRDETVTIGERYFALEAQKRKTNTLGFTVQSFLLRDSLVTTIGQREDRVYTSRQRAIPNLADGFADESLLEDHSYYGRDKKWRSGKTDTKGAVLKPFQSFSFFQRSDRTGLPRYAAEFMRGLNFHYSKNNSFKPEDVAYNVYLEELRNPSAEAEEYGFSINMFNAFRLRLTHHETNQVDKRGGTGVIGTRAVSIDFDIPGQTRNFDLFGDATTWALQRNPSLTLEQAQAEAATQIGTTLERIRSFDGKSINDSSNSLSRGWELEVQFNPNRYWTVKVAGNKQEAIDSGVSVAIQKYINERLPIWTTIRNPEGNLWWTTDGAGDIPVDYYFQNVRAPLDLAITTQGKSKPQLRKYSVNLSTQYQLAGLTSNKWLRSMDIGGSFRWASKSAVGYLAGAPDPDGVVRSLDGNKPVFDDPTTSLDLNIGYRTKLFNSRIGARFQLNVRNVTEGGRLQGVGVNPDGQYWRYRIIDPRQFIFSTTFDL